jgi:hypothetical protein
MTRVARLFFIIAVMSAAGSWSIELAEKRHEGDGAAIDRSLLFLCAHVVRVAAANKMVDRNMAIDQAFTVFKSEESKLQAFEKSASVSAHRDTLREELFRR